jgi:hypothetical protein
VSVDKIARALGAVEAEDREELARIVEADAHRDCELESLIDAALEGSYRGRDGVSQFFDDLLNSFAVRYVGGDLRSGRAAFRQLTGLGVYGPQNPSLVELAAEEPLGA